MVWQHDRFQPLTQNAKQTAMRLLSLSSDSNPVHITHFPYFPAPLCSGFTALLQLPDYHSIPIQIDSNRFDSFYKSIRFSKKSDRSIQPQIVGVCMQSSPTLIVCALYAGIIHLLLFHNSVRIAT